MKDVNRITGYVSMVGTHTHALPDVHDEYFRVTDENTGRSEVIHHAIPRLKRDIDMFNEVTVRFTEIPERIGGVGQLSNLVSIKFHE